MSVPYLNSLLWVPIDQISTNMDKELLTLTTKSYTGESKEVECWKICGDWIGFPRAFGLEQMLSWEVITDKTRFPLADVACTVDDISWRRGQHKAVNTMYNLFEAGHLGIRLQSPPASGKTLMALTVAAMFKTPTLIIVHKEDLVEQWRDTIKKFFPGATVGHVQAKKWDWVDKQFVTAMAQTLYRRRKKLPSGFRDAFGMVIYDEGHHYPSATFEKVLGMFPAKLRLAVSATWRRGDGLDELWNWHIGSKVVIAETSRLVGGYVQVPWNTNINDSWFISYVDGHREVNRAHLLTLIVKQKSFSKWLAEQCKKSAAAGRKVLLVSERIKQLSDVKEFLLIDGIEVGVYCRTFPKGDDKRASVSNEELRGAKEKSIILATYGMMSEGSDVPALDTLILGTPRSDVEQVVGRIQRPHATKKSLLVVDPIFQTKYCQSGGDKRKLQYDELGFTERK